MSLPFRTPSLKTCVRLAVLAAIAALAVVFDWNWFRPQLVDYLAEQSNREVKIEDLQVSIDRSLEPTVRVRGLQIGNAPWADTPRPLAVAAEVAFTFSWQSVVEWRPILSKLTLVDADIDLQRQADGLRNWRLREPDDRDPGRLKVMSLQAERTRIRFVHRGIGLEVKTAVTALAEPATLPKHDNAAPMTQQVEVSGRFGELHFTGQVQTAAVMTFMETEQAFPLRGHLAVAQTRLEAEGLVADLFDPSTVEATVRLAGPSLSQLGAALPRTQPYKLQSQLRKERALPDYTFTSLKVTLGDSVLTGEADVDPSDDRPLMHATLSGDQLRLADLRSPAGPSGPTGENPGLLPADPLTPSSWRRVDAHLELKLKAFQLAEDLPLLQNLSFSGHLDNGALDISPIHFGIGGGQATFRLALDTRTDPPTAETELSLRQLRLEKLLPDLPDNARLTGPLNGRLRLKGQGRSLAEIAGSANGSAEVTVDGGSIASPLEAKLTLDGGKLVRGFLTGERPVALRCGAIAVDFKQGRGTTRQVWLETEHTQTGGSGSVDLRGERFELLLAPHSKDNSLLALNKPLRVQGSFRHAEVGLSPTGAPASAAQGCKLGKAAAAAVE